VDVGIAIGAGGREHRYRAREERSPGCCRRYRAREKDLCKTFPEYRPSDWVQYVRDPACRRGPSYARYGGSPDECQYGDCFGQCEALHTFR
jgi:hypothetical protein